VTAAAPSVAPMTDAPRGRTGARPTILIEGEPAAPATATVATEPTPVTSTSEVTRATRDWPGLCLVMADSLA
jgi:hypothetical protein